MGLELGLYPKRHDMPCFHCAPDTPAPPAEKDEDAAARRAARTASANASSAAGTGTGAGTEEGKQVEREDKSVKSLRAKCRNTLFLAGEVLGREGLQDLTRTVTTVAGPVHKAHSAHAHHLRSPDASRD
eukprot:4026840-Lingulodinium_polyedra.AAC.1